MPAGWGPRLTGTLRLVLPLVVALHGVFPLVYLMLVFVKGPGHGDWSHLKRVADHFVAGDWANLYTIGPGAIDPQYFWRYPPFALYGIAPLAALSPGGAYAALAGTGVVALGASMILLGRLLDLRKVRHEWVLLIVCSAPALTTLITGQNSALLTLTVVGAAWLWSRGHPNAACAVLGLLAVKPNWGAFFGLYAIVRGEWRGAAVMAGVAALLCLTTLPLGSGLWAGFLQASLSNDTILASYESFKLITLKGFLDATIPSARAALVVWALASVCLVTAAVVIWRAQAARVEHLAAIVLLTIAVNPYASFYDALLLVIPASVWWTERERWRHGRWVAVGLLIALAWIWEHAISTWGGWFEQSLGAFRPPFSLVGPVTATWLALWAIEVRHQRRSIPTSDSSESVQ